MRRLAFLALVLVACGGGSKNSAPDLSAQGDFALPVVSKCLGIVACASGCSTPDCVASCEVPADAASIQAYEALVNCSLAACATGSDAGADAGLACDSTDKTCLECVDQAVHGQSSTCSTEYAACVS